MSNQKDKSQFILWFNQIGIEDIPKVGGKNASLWEMYSNLTPRGIAVPNGFAITAYTYRYLLEKSGTQEEIKKIIAKTDISDTRQLFKAGKEIRSLIRNIEFPPEVVAEIKESYEQLSKQYNKEAVDVAVRSSATAEDLPDASFAGQQETYLNVHSLSDLLHACSKCFASLFTNRAISYREEKGFDHFEIALSITVQKMVRSDLACSGVMFSIDTESGFKDTALVTGSWGLGENIVQGAVTPDEFLVHKPTMQAGFESIISKKLGSKSITMIYDQNGNKNVKNIQTSEKKKKQFILNNQEIITLAKWTTAIEEYYTQKRSKYTPMDMEWAKDGETNELFIVQARPETIQSQRDFSILSEYKLKETGEIVVTGQSVGSKIGEGKADIILDVKDIHSFKKGSILVTEMTDPDWEPIMKKASGIITNRWGRTCHAAIISRELGIPCVVGCGDATEKITDGQEITLDCSSGEVGNIYEGFLKYDTIDYDLKNINPTIKTDTGECQITLNVGNPSQAFNHSFIPNNGVGLAREEFIINSYIKIHPLALLNYDSLTDQTEKAKIDELTEGYQNKSDYYVDKLAQGIAQIAAAFYPKKVILRLADFKSDEYSNLIGGKQFEPTEANPMIGWRGASRFYNPDYKPAFALECQAIKKVRETMGLNNLQIMVPFCRTIQEGKDVLTELAKNGLKQHENDLKVYLMCEVPSNVVLADEFLDIFDGYSIWSNDLTQLTLGIDRNSEVLSYLFDERNEAVKQSIKKVIDIANRKGKYIGICGQGPSDYPDFAQFLLDNGIQAMSLNPDSVIKTIKTISKS